MKAIICTKYGAPEVLEIHEIAQPVPKDNEVLIKIHATTVTSGDVTIRAAKGPVLYRLPMRIILGFTRPRQPVLGTELSGVVEAVGKNVTRYEKGDPVFAFNGMRLGAYAEYICLPEDGMISIKPSNVSYEEAAAVLFGGTTALHFFRKGNIRPGLKVLIFGASGASGSSAVQIAKHYGTEVTGVCSTANVELVKSLGADDVMDYKKEDFTESGKKYDIIFDAVGKISKSRCKKALAQDGVFLTVNGQGIVKERVEDVTFIKKLMEAGELKAVIDRAYPMEQVREAHRYVDQRHKKGNVVLKMI